MKAPAFQFYPKDILTDEACSAMNLREFGAHVRLICHAWLEGSIPADFDRLARLLRVSRKSFDALWPAVAQCWQERDGRFFQERLEIERGKQKARSALNSEKGSKGGRPLESTARESRGFSPAKPNKSFATATATATAEQRTGSKEESRARENPLVDVTKLNAEGLALIREIERLSNLDPGEILVKASDWRGRGYVRLDVIPPDRLAYTVNALRTWARRLRGEDEPGPPKPAEEAPRPLSYREKAIARELALKAAEQAAADDAARNRAAEQ